MNNPPAIRKSTASSMTTSRTLANKTESKNEKDPNVTVSTSETARDLSTLGELTRPIDVGAPYDPDPERERNRTILAIGSFAVFAIVVLALLFASICGRKWDDLALPASVLLPAVSAICATSLTFFFTTEKKRNGTRR